MLAKTKIITAVLMGGLFISPIVHAQTGMQDAQQNNSATQTDTVPISNSQSTAPQSNLPATTSDAQALNAAPSSSENTAASNNPLSSNTDTVASEPQITELTSERDDKLPHDLSPLGMFMAADWVVKAVMIGLALASLLTWTVWIAKSFELAAAKRRLKRVNKIVGHSRSLDDAVSSLTGEKGYAAVLVRAASDEVEMTRPALEVAGSEGLKDRVASRLSRIEAAAGRKLSRGTGALATIGSVAPFVGLFGTVWGIMNSFISISESQTTNLAVVAPGIAEALLATAIGLVAAIPAVMIYNMFARSITGYRQSLADVSAGVERLISRDDDFQRAGLQGRTASSLKAAE